MSMQATQSAAASGQSSGHGAVHKPHMSAFGACASAIAAWIGGGGERKALRELAREERLLRDIGLTREQVLQEAHKPFWRR